MTEGLVTAMITEEIRLKELLKQFNSEVLRNVDEYVINLGRFSPNGQSSALRDFKTELEEKGYGTRLTFHQDTKNYHLEISKVKLKLPYKI